MTEITLFYSAGHKGPVTEERLNPIVDACLPQAASLGGS